MNKESKLKRENDDLRKRLGELERSLASLQVQKKESDNLLEHMLDSTVAEASEKKASLPRPSKKRPPKASPVHKRKKIPEKPKEVCNEKERYMRGWEEMEEKIKKNLHKCMGQLGVEKRFDERLIMMKTQYHPP